MNKEIAKSPEILAKEALIKELQTNLVKRKRVLKGLKTRLENTKNEITNIQRAGTGQVMSKMSQMENLRLELLDLVQQMNKIKGLSREDKAALKDMKEQFSDGELFGEEFQDYKDQMEEMESENFEAHFDENARAKMRDLFETFTVKPNKEEQKDIRKIFISLSQKFHPDKATTKADEKEYHEMMQKINEAYQAGDIHTLLELEQLFLTEKLDLTKVQSFSVDVLQQELDRLERDLQFIESQIDRNKAELKNLRTSDLGQMLTDVKKAEKEGMGMEAAFAQLDDSIHHLSKMRDVFVECIKVGHTGPLNAMLEADSAMQPSQDDMMTMLGEMLGGDMTPEDLEKMFGFEDDDLFNFGDETVKNAKFRKGQSVKIAKKVSDEDSGIALGGLQGRIEDIFHGYNMEILYEIELDSISLNKLPLKYVKEMVLEEEDFQNFEIAEADLKKCQPRDSEEETKSAYRILFHQYNWDFLDDATQKRLQSILLQKTDGLDWENWKLFLNKKLKFPMTAYSRGMIEFKKGEKLKITRLAGYNEEVGIIVDADYRNRPGNYPLFDLMPPNKAKKLREIFDDYLTWVEETHDVGGF